MGQLETKKLIFPYVEPGTHLFRFLDHRTAHFWAAISDVLTEQKLYLNSRTSFNDPYDSQPDIQDDLSISILRRHLREMTTTNPWAPDRSPLSVARLLLLKEQGNMHIGKRQQSDIKRDTRNSAIEFLDTCGLISFSLSAENPLLWGHYAGASTGVCLVFRRGSSTHSAFCMCAKILYTNDRPRLPLSIFYQLARARMAGDPINDIVNQICFLSFFHKSRTWEHEREARIYFPFHAFKKIDFDRHEFVGIILGPKSSPQLEDRLQETIREAGSSVQIHKATLSSNDFRVVLPEPFSNL